MRRFLLPLALATTLAFMGYTPAPAAAQAETSVQQQTKAGIAVKVRGQEVLTLADAGQTSARQRAQMFRSRLRDELMPDPRSQFEPVKAGDVSVEIVNNMPVLKFRDASLITITHADAKLVGLPPQQAAERFADNLESALAKFELGKGRNFPSDFIALVPVAQSRIAAQQGQPAPRGAERRSERADERAAAQPGMQEVEFASVRLKNREVMRLFEAGDMSAEQRANMVRERIRQALQTGANQTVQPVRQTDIDVQTINNMPVIRLREANLITVTHKDAQLQGAKSADDLAQQWADELRSALTELELQAGQPLPTDIVTVATGTLTVPTARTGGGAGTTPAQPKQKKEKERKHKH